MTTPNNLQRELQQMLDRWRVRANVVKLDPKRGGDAVEFRRGGQRIATIPIASSSAGTTSDRTLGF